MILWIYKLISTARRAIAGRKYPHQLAWAVAFGLMLGAIPHGNLLALMVLLVVLSLKINHAMAGLTAVGTTFVAAYMDPYSHQVGDFVLTHPSVRETAVAAWQLPLVPWTDLNNTVVMGSFLIGAGALLPVFAVTYPIFRLFAPKTSADPGPSHVAQAKRREKERAKAAAQSKAIPHQLVLVDQGHATVAPPHRSDETLPVQSLPVQSLPVQSLPVQSLPVQAEQRTEDVEFIELDPPAASGEPRMAVETRIDVIRMKDHRNVGTSDDSKTKDVTDELSTDGQPMDEALNYLLRQLRDSQQRKAA